MTDEPAQAYSDAYAAAHGRFAVIPAAYVLLFDPQGRVLLQHRVDTGYYDDWWGASAAGHVEAGEPVTLGAVREASEELGVTIASDALAPLTTMHRRGRDDRPTEQRVDFFFGCRDWQGVPELRESTADELRWFALDALPARVVHHERHVLDLIAAGSLPSITVYGFDRTES
ncbi:NUDIX domain-containing protein [Agromyces larvae]|uniref:NUDIX domain-containing protein n=1 Tax=Agromyces larvae TaxID=2929802 RepID=A0ABY4BV31_9MICO|nr:NUDIX domain-containing protein [Agromyces larvae]UOE43039.1 NUDIX domain-containing protein [Agromyces larvae]